MQVDPEFIARRIMILASEDIGNADPQALLILHMQLGQLRSWIGAELTLRKAVIYGTSTKI